MLWFLFHPSFLTRSMMNPSAWPPLFPAGPGHCAVLSESLLWFPDWLPHSQVSAQQPGSSHYTITKIMLLQCTEPSVAPYYSQWRSPGIKFSKTLYDQAPATSQTPLSSTFPITLLLDLVYTKAIPPSGPLISLSAAVTFAFLLFFEHSGAASGHLHLLLLHLKVSFPDTCTTTSSLLFLDLFWNVVFSRSPSLVFLSQLFTLAVISLCT